MGQANTTAMEAFVENLNIERASDMKEGGIKHQGTAESVSELIRDLWSILLDRYDRDSIKMDSVTDGAGF